MLLQEYPPRVRSVLEELGIPAELISARALPVHTEAHELVVAEYDENGREHLLVPAAAGAWRHLTAAARSDNVNLQIASAFRSFERQAEIVRTGVFVRPRSNPTVERDARKSGAHPSL